MTSLPSLNRFPYSSLRSRPDFNWPDGKRLAVHIAINLEHFIFGEGGVDLDRPTPAPNHRSYLWRDYGIRVGGWRLLDLFDEFKLPIGVITNASIYDHCPESIAAFRDRGDEIIGHGITNNRPWRSSCNSTIHQRRLGTWRSKSSQKFWRELVLACSGRRLYMGNPRQT